MKRKKYFFLGALFLLPIVLLLIFNLGEQHYRLDVLTKDHVDTIRVYNPKSSYCPDDTTAIHTIPPFEFTNQNGEAINNKTLEGQIYVAGFFFTTCPDICTDLTRQLLRVQEALGVRKDVKILYHTVNPRYDSVAVLKAYARSRGIDATMWFLLTGAQSKIFDLANCGYFVAAEERPQEFVHTDKFILVDRVGHIRGFYTGTDKAEVDRLITEIQILLLES